MQMLPCSTRHEGSLCVEVRWAWSCSGCVWRNNTFLRHIMWFFLDHLLPLFWRIVAEMLLHRMFCSLLLPLMSTCKPALPHNRCWFSFFLFIECKFFKLNKKCCFCTCRYLSDLHAPGDPAWQCIYAQHKWILQLMQNCRDEFISGQRGDWLAQHIHTAELTRSTHESEKPLFSVSNQAAGGRHVSLKGSWGKRESQLPLRLVPAPTPLPSVSALPCPRPKCLFFHECMNKMKVREHWLWIWVSGLDMLLHTHAYKLSLSLTHSFTDGLEQLTPIKLFLC